MFTTIAILAVVGIVLAGLVALLWHQPAAPPAGRGVETREGAEKRRSPREFPEIRSRPDRYGPN